MINKSPHDVHRSKLKFVADLSWLLRVQFHRLSERANAFIPKNTEQPPLNQNATTPFHYTAQK